MPKAPQRLHRTVPKGKSAPKPARRAIESRFRFKSAAQQLSQIDVQSLYLLDLPVELAQESENVFLDLVEARAANNSSLPFQRFCSNVKPRSRSLPLLLHHSQFVANHIAAALLANDNLYAAPDILDTIPALFIALPDPTISCQLTNALLRPLLNFAIHSSESAQTIKALQIASWIIDRIASQLYADTATLDAIWVAFRHALGASAAATHPTSSPLDTIKTQEDSDDWQEESSTHSHQLNWTTTPQMRSLVAAIFASVLAASATLDQSIRVITIIVDDISRLLEYAESSADDVARSFTKAIVYEGRHKRYNAPSDAHLSLQALWQITADIHTPNPFADIVESALIALIRSAPLPTSRALLSNLVMRPLKLSKHPSLLNLAVIATALNKGTRLPFDFRKQLWSIAIDDCANADTWLLRVALVYTASEKDEFKLVNKLLQEVWHHDCLTACTFVNRLLRLDWQLAQLVLVPFLSTNVFCKPANNIQQELQIAASLEERSLWSMMSPSQEWFGSASLHFQQQVDLWQRLGESDETSQGLADLVSLIPLDFLQDLQTLQTLLLLRPSQVLSAPLASNTLLLASVIAKTNAISSTQLHTLVQEYACSTEVMDALLLYASKQHVALDSTLLALLIPTLAKAPSALASSILRIIASTSTDQAVCATANLCLQTATIDLLPHLARERSMYIRRVYQTTTSKDNSSALSVALAFLTSQLFLGFRPVWQDAIEAIRQLSLHHASIVWDQIEILLSSAVHCQVGSAQIYNPSEDVTPRQSKDKPWLDEKEWHDQTVTKIQSTEEHKIRPLSPTSSSVLPTASFIESQLLSLLAAIPSLVVSKNRKLVDLYLHISSQDRAFGGKLGRARLLPWFATFASTKNCSALTKAPILRTHAQTYLAQGDPDVRAAAINFLSHYAGSPVQRYEAVFRNLLDNSKFREQLLDLSLINVDASARDGTDYYQTLVPFLYGELVSAHRTSTQAARRIAILHAMKSFDEVAFQQLVAWMTSFVSGPNVSSKRIRGYLSLLGEVLKHLGSRLSSEWGQLFGVMDDIHRNVSNPESKGKEFEKDAHRLILLRFQDLFALAPTGFDFTPFMPSTYAFIRAKLPAFAAENAQSPSALLQLFVAWSRYPNTVQLLSTSEQNILPSVYQVLLTRNVKPEVIAAVFELVENLFNANQVRTAKTDQELHLEELCVALEHMLITRQVQFSSSNVQDRQLLSILHTLIGTSTNTHTDAYLRLLVPLLSKSPKTVSDRTKKELLELVVGLLENLGEAEIQESTLSTLSHTLASCFSTVQETSSRSALVKAFTIVASQQPHLSLAAAILEDLNSNSLRRLEEPDFERRISRFGTLDADTLAQIPLPALPALLHCMLFFMQDIEEGSMRENARIILVRWIDLAKTDAGISRNVQQILIPGLRLAFKSRAELVLREAVDVFGYIVATAAELANLEELQPLLADGDEEANFFNNIFHIQTHRRTRSLRRLADLVRTSPIPPENIKSWILPLLLHFIFSEVGNDGELRNEAIACIGFVAGRLPWQAYRQLLQRFRHSLCKTDSLQKVYMRATLSILRNFDHIPPSSTVDSPIITYLDSTLIPSFLKFLESRQEADETIRIPLAIGIACIIRRLPQCLQDLHTSSLAMNLAQVLRSKSQDVRDTVRKTITEITAVLGTACLSSMIQELKAALSRGPQLHILAFTIHYILRFLVDSSSYATGDVSQALPTIVDIASNDLLGAPAGDRRSSEFRAGTQVVETRATKSFDTCEILASIITPNQLAILLGPFQSACFGSVDYQSQNSLVEVFRRISAGLQKNSTFTAENVCVLAYESLSRKSDAFITCFGLDLLNAAFKKNRFDLQDPELLKRLNPLVNLVAEALDAQDAQIMDKSLRAIATLVRCPIPSVQKGAPVIFKRVFKIVQSFETASSDIAQSSIRTLSNLLQTNPSIQLSETEIAGLLKMIDADLEESDGQLVLFGLLRTLLSRKVQAWQLYDLMARVSQIMITSQSPHIRELSRSIFLQFLMDYEQTSSRIKACIASLANNLAYQHESGRQSALEFIGAIITKFSLLWLENSSKLLFAALTLVVANDASLQCREIALILIQNLYNRMPEVDQQSAKTLLVSWIRPRENPSLATAAAQVASKIPKNSATFSRAISDLIFEELGGVARETEVVGMDNFVVAAFNTLAQVAPSLASPTWTPSILLFLSWPQPTVQLATLQTIYAYLQNPKGPPSFETLQEIAEASFGLLRKITLTDTLSLQLVRNLFIIGKLFSDAPKVVSKPDASVSPELESQEPMEWMFISMSSLVQVSHNKRPSSFDENGSTWVNSPIAGLRWFASMVTELSPESITLYLESILRPTLRICEDPNANSEAMVSLQKLGQELLDLTREKVGDDVYLGKVNNLRMQATDKRNKRKAEEALRAVKEPEKDARRKEKRNEAKTRNKKRKIAAHAGKRPATSMYKIKRNVD